MTTETNCPHCGADQKDHWQLPSFAFEDALVWIQCTECGEYFYARAAIENGRLVWSYEKDEEDDDL